MDTLKFFIIADRFALNSPEFVSKRVQGITQMIIHEKTVYINAEALRDAD